MTRLTTPRTNRFIPSDPTANAKQAAMLLLDDVLEIFYGGAGGGGKSEGLLMAAAQYVDVPGYAALIIRRNYKQLSLPGALMHRAHTWWDSDPDVEWREGAKTWTFPSGASITFGHILNDSDIANYEGAELQFIGIDEAPQFPEAVYTFLFSRLRRLAGMPVPTRMRSAGNPVGIGFEWIKRRFVNPDTRAEGAVFIPARLRDNPFIDVADYEANLAHLSPTLRAKIMDGDWTVTEGGSIFRPYEWLEKELWVDKPWTKTKGVFRCRAWDLAHAEATGRNDPDYTVGTLMAIDRHTGQFCVEDVVRFRATGGTVEDRVASTAGRDGSSVHVGIERTPGAGAAVFDRYRRHVLRGYTVKAEAPIGKKAERAEPYAAAMENGVITVVRADWNVDWLAEHDQFDGLGKLHDDQVDSAAYAHRRCSNRAGRKASASSTQAEPLKVGLPGGR